MKLTIGVILLKLPVKCIHSWSVFRPERAILHNLQSNSQAGQKGQRHFIPIVKLEFIVTVQKYFVMKIKQHSLEWRASCPIKEKDKLSLFI